MIRALSLAALLVGAAAHLLPRHEYEAKFVDWMKEYGVQFQSGEEFVHRLGIFADNDDYITTENAKNVAYKLGHNEYSMYDHEEFKQIMNLGRGMPQRQSGNNVHHETGVAVPSSVDWVSAGAVTGVKDQGSCGSCWSFSTTGCLEGAYFLKYGHLVSFSEQMLVSCDTTDHGCNGGWMDDAFAWIQKNGGLCSEEDYPYTSGNGQRGSCKSSSCSLVSGSRISGWTDVAQTESALQSAVALQPVSVAIEADQRAFQLYKSGVFTASCGTNLDHGVLTVGYGVYTDGTPYWKVKNSWGTSWGMDGYILLERNTGTYGGQCGITLAASYASV